jgi:hypothetical protein
MALDTTRLFENYIDKDRDAVTLLVAQSLLALAVESDPVAKLTEQYREGISAPSVDFFCYPSTRLTTSGDTVLPSPFKPGAKILVKHLAYMDEAHVSHLLRYPSTPLALNNHSFLHIPLRTVLGKTYHTIALLQAMLGKGLRVIKKEHLHEPLPDYGYDITTTTLSIVFDPKRTYIPTAIYMRWPSAINVPTVRVGSSPMALWPPTMYETPMGDAHKIYVEDSWESNH